MNDNIRVGLLEFVTEYDPSINTKNILVNSYIFVSLMTIINAICLSGYVDGWNLSSFFSSKHKDMFYSSAFDSFWVIVFITSFILPLLAYCSIITGRIPNEITTTTNKESKCCGLFSARGFGYSSVTTDADPDDVEGSRSNSFLSEDGQPLYQTHSTLASDVASTLFSDKAEEGYEFEDAAAKSDNKALDEVYLTVRETKEWHSTFWTGVLFTVSCGVQVRSCEADSYYLCYCYCLLARRLC